MPRPRFTTGLSLLAAACSAAGGASGRSASSTAARVQVQATRSHYAPGARLVLLVRNRSRDTVFNDACGGTVEAVGGADVAMGRECDDFGAAGWRRTSRPIAPGRTGRDSTLFIPLAAPPGSWRAVLLLRDRQGTPLPTVERTARFVVDPR